MGRKERKKAGEVAASLQALQQREEEADKLVAEAVAAVKQQETAEVYHVLVKALTEIRDSVVGEAGVASPNLDIKGCPEARQLVHMIRSNIRALNGAEPKDLAAAWAHVRGVSQRVTCQMVHIFASQHVEKNKLLQLHPDWNDEIAQYDILCRKITEIMISKGGLHYDVYLMEVITLLQGAFTVWATALADGLENCWASNDELVEAVEKAVMSTVDSTLKFENKQLLATVRTLQETTETLLERVDRMEQEHKEQLKRLRACEVYMDKAKFQSMTLAPCPTLAPMTRGRDGALTSREMHTLAYNRALRENSPLPVPDQKHLHTLAHHRARRENSPLPVPLYVAPRACSLPPQPLLKNLKTGQLENLKN